MEGDDKNVLKLLKREGRKDKGLCVQVLHYFVRVSTEEKINFKCKTEIEGDDNVMENEDGSDEGSGGEESVSEEEKYVLTYAFRPFFHLFMFSFLFIFHFCLFFIFSLIL